MFEKPQLKRFSGRNNIEHIEDIPFERQVKPGQTGSAYLVSFGVKQT